MTWSFNSWLRTHRAEIESQWLESSQDLPAYSILERECSRSSSPVDMLLTGQDEELENNVHQWASHMVQEQDVAPTDLISSIDKLSQTIQDLLPTEADAGQANKKVNVMVTSLARWVAEDAERLDNEKSQLASLYEITRELTSSLDMRRVLYRTLQEVTATIKAEKGVIFLTDEEKEQALPHVKIDWEGQGFPLSALPSTWCLGQPEPLLTLEDRQDEQAKELIERLDGPEVRSLIAAPIVAHGEFIGFLVATKSNSDAFTSEHIRLIRNVLSHMAGAIANAEVYRLIRGQAQELGQMLRHQKEESSKKQAMLTSIADGVVVNNTEGETIMVNPAAERILDTPEDQLTGRDFDELFSVFKEPGEMEAVDTMENLLSKRGQDISKAHKMVLEMDQRVINATLSPVQTQEGDFLGVVTILRDVTKEVEADRAKSQFISTVSHELRTPMTAIKGYTDLLHAGSVGSITDEQKRFLGIIRSNTNRLTALINDLLDISRVETGRVRFEPELMQIGDVIADVVTALAGQAESKDQTLTYEVDGGLPEIMGDWDRLNQVLTNLIGNAIHYTPEGGSVEVQAYPVENAVRVDVRDTGIGIASEDLARIFERFYRADHPIVQEARGTGLGLSIVKMFVEMHGGRVWVESEPGEGSTFTFILPLPVGREEKDRHTLPRLAARTRTVLVVDDERDVAELIGVQLEKEGYQIQVLGRGAPVVDWVEENQPDLVILDLLLPDMDGVDVLRALKENDLTADIPVIVLTIVPDDGSIWKLGITDYITKPAEADELLESVEDALTWQGRVLIVEDHPDTVGMISTAMRQIGFTPLVAADGYEALMKARRYRPDLVLLDLRLPGMDGYEALTHFKRDAVTQSIPIVAISAHVADVPQERKRLIALGASSFLPKPFAIEDLLEEVETALQPVSGPSSL